MFGRSKPVVFDPYRGRRSGVGVPRWLVLLLLGAAAGIAGVLYTQHAWLPPRLSAAETAALRQAFQQADADRTRLQSELAQATEGLKQAKAVVGHLESGAEAASDELGTLRDDLAAVVDALPPDPRDGAVAVRSARFSTRNGQLDYSIVLTRAKAGAQPLKGVMQFIVSGPSATQADAAVSLKPVALTIGRQEVARGSVPLPPGLQPRQAVVKVLDKPEGRQLGMRVLLVD
ncbi:MAG: hypothetical protein OEW22_01270 [Rubrivivax sp.]|nr:hypothetical protein [Rubrivivax sp.]